MEEKIELALLIEETKETVNPQPLNWESLLKCGYNSEALEEIGLFTAMMGEHDYTILNDNLNQVLMNINFNILKNWFSEKRVNPSGLNLGTSQLLLNLSGNIKYENYRCSGLMFTDEVTIGNHSLNKLVRSYIISHELNYRTKVEPTFDDSEEISCLPYIKNLIDFINDLCDVDLVANYFQANGAMVLSRLFNFFSISELEKLEGYFGELDHFNTIYKLNNLDEMQIKRLKEVISELEMMLMIAYHNKCSESLQRVR